MTVNTHRFRRPRRPFSLPASVIATVLLASLLGSVAHAASPPMTDSGGPGSGSSNEANVYRLFHDVFTGKNPAACPELVANGAVIHTPDGEYQGHEGMTGYVDGLRASFPDASFVLADLMANGDTIAARWVMTGTHDGAFQGIAASGTPVSLEGIAILRFELGMVVEQWVSYDRLHVMQQIEIDADVQDGPSRVCPPCQTPE